MTFKIFPLIVHSRFVIFYYRLTMVRHPTFQNISGTVSTRYFLFKKSLKESYRLGHYKNANSPVIKEEWIESDPTSGGTSHLRV